MQKKAAFRFVSIVARHSSSVSCSMRVDEAMAALLTSTSRRPNRSTMPAISARTVGELLMSPGAGQESPPNSRARISARSGVRTLTATCAPRSMKRSAVARPKPRAAPVINTTRSVKSCVMSCAPDDVPFPGGVLRDPSLNQLPHQCGRQWTLRLKADGALAGVVVLEFVLVGFHRVNAGIECAEFLSRAKGDQQSAAQREAWNSVADALFSLGRGGLDDLAKLLQRSSLLCI